MKRVVGFPERLLSLLVLVSLVVGVAASTAAAHDGPAAEHPTTFTDVHAGRFYVTAVDWMVRNQIMTGTSPTTFTPDRDVTRGEAAAFLWRMRCEPAAAGSHAFVDVGALRQQNPVAWLAGLGAAPVAGTGSEPAGRFGPSVPLTRAQIAAMLFAVAGEQAVSDLEQARVLPFTDLTAAWQADPVRWLLYREITTGTSATTFHPDRPVTRAEFATFLWRYVGKPSAVSVQCPGTRTDDMADDMSSSSAGVSVTMARAYWSTGYFQAQVYKQLLEELGYSVTEPSELELGPSLAYLGMAQGEIDFWVNSWYPGDVSWWAPELPDGSTVGDHLTIVGNEMIAGALQGFLITKSFADEYGVTHLDQINDDPEILAAFDAGDQFPGNGVADVYGCTEFWTCDDIIDSQIAFSGWTNIAQFKAHYDDMFAEATAKANAGEPMVIYTWAPTSYITQLRPGDNVYWLAVDAVIDDSNPTGLEGGEGHDQRPGQANIGPDACPAAANADNCQLGWATADIQVTANTDWLHADPYAAELLCRVVLSRNDVSLANLDIANAGSDATEDFIAGLATDWIVANRGTVDEWLGAARIPPMEPSCPGTVIPPLLQ